MTGTGLKKCMPTTRDGAAVAAAISVTDREEVFVARMQSSPKCSAACGEDRRLDVEVLQDGLDDERARLRAAPRPIASYVTRRSSRAAAISGLPSRQARAMSATAASSWCGSGIDQADPVSGRQRDLGDPAAHGAGPDHAHRSGAQSSCVQSSIVSRGRRVQ